MRITPDTNILISATFWSGASDKIMTQVECGKSELVLSEEIIKEYSDVLEYKEIQDKIKDKGLELKRTVRKIISISIIISPKEKLDVIKEDPDDNKILECAVAGDVDYIISNDKHLLKLGQFNDILIITPEEFIDKAGMGKRIKRGNYLNEKEARKRLGL